MVKVPSPLPLYVAEKRCVLFVGAGLSAAAKLPTWHGLLTALIDRAEQSAGQSAVDEMRKLLERGRYLDVADHCRTILGTSVHEILSMVRGANEPIPQPHKVLRALPWAAIVTTNYDKLLERAYGEIGDWPKTPTHADTSMLGTVLFDRAFFILKAHGDIDRPDTIVLSTTDYRDITHSNAAFQSFISAMLLNYCLLFVGYSLSDPDFRLLLDRQLTTFKGYAPPRYAIMEDVGPVEAQVLFRNAGINVISYPKGEHGTVVEFLEALTSEIGAKKETAATAVPLAARGPLEIRATAELTTVQRAAQLTLTAKGNILSATLVNGDTAGTGNREFDPARIEAALRKVLKEPFLEKEAALAVGKKLRAALPPVIADAIDTIADGTPLAIIADDSLWTYPWEWLAIRDNQLLSLRAAVFRQSIALTATARGRPRVSQPLDVLIIGDTMVEAPLPASLKESQEIAEIYQEAGANVELLVGERATFETCVARLRERRYDVVHFSGHAAARSSEPILFLAGGVALEPLDLRSFLSTSPPAVLFLNSHHTAFMPADPSSNGFMAVSTAAGVGAFIGGFGSMFDAGSRQVGVRFHKELIDGQPVAAALLRARQASAKKAADPSWMSFACGGYGDLRIV